MLLPYATAAAFILSYKSVLGDGISTASSQTCRKHISSKRPHKHCCDYQDDQNQYRYRNDNSGDYRDSKTGNDEDNFNFIRHEDYYCPCHKSDSYNHYYR